jgi:hypothetical protein
MSGWQQKTRIHRALSSRQRGQTIKKVADKIGLLSFGAVDHHRDEHDVVLGLTTSTSHKDRHYAVGSFDGYDIAIVDRSDTSRQPKGKKSHHNWVIVQVSLPQAQDVPHVFLLPSSKDEKFLHLFAGARHLSPLSDFADRYIPYVTPRHNHSAHELLNDSLTKGIAAHFWPHAVEWHRKHVYVYITEHRLSETVLGSAIQSALWLADMLDQRFA